MLNLLLLAITATATLLSGGSANDITQSANIAESAIEHNSLLHPSFDPDIEQKKIENLRAAGDLAVELVKEHPYEVLGVTSDLASLAFMGPSAIVAVSRIKNLLGLGKGVEKLTAPPTGKIIEGFALNPLEPKPQEIVTQKRSVVFKDNPTINVVNKAPNKITTTEVDTKNLPAPSVSGSASNVGEKVNKNSHEYVGESHVYKIRNVTKDKTHKIGESAAGVRVRDGKSKRAEAQVRKLEKENPGQKFESKIIRNFDTKKDAYKHEEKLIKRYRKTFEDKKDILPGNKGNH